MKHEVNTGFKLPDLQRACFDKRPYEKKTAARDAGARLGLTPYHCMICHKWHLTSQPKTSMPGIKNKLRKRALKP